MKKIILLGLIILAHLAFVACKEKTEEKMVVEKTTAENNTIVEKSAAEKMDVEKTDPKIASEKSSLFKAIENGNVEQLKVAIANGADVNGTCEILDEVNTCFNAGHKNLCPDKGAESLTPIYLAIVKGNVEVIKVLMDAGANLFEPVNACEYVCEPECSYELWEHTPLSKIFFPGYTDSARFDPTDERINIFMALSENDKDLQDGSFSEPVYASSFLSNPRASEENLIVFFKKAKSRNQLVYDEYDMGYAKNKIYFKTALNYAEEMGRKKVAAYLRSIGAKKVVRFHPYKLSKKDGQIFYDSVCEDIHKVYYDDGTSVLTLDECGT